MKKIFGLMFMLLIFGLLAGVAVASGTNDYGGDGGFAYSIGEPIGTGASALGQNTMPAVIFEMSDGESGWDGEMDSPAYLATNYRNPILAGKDYLPDLGKESVVR